MPLPLSPGGASVDQPTAHGNRSAHETSPLGAKERHMNEPDEDRERPGEAAEAMKETVEKIQRGARGDLPLCPWQTPDAVV